MLELVGRQDVSFLNDRNERVEGIKLHFLCDDDRVVGRMASTQFFGTCHALYGKACSVPFGLFDLVYGPRGRITDIIVPAVSESKKQ